jgi:serine/threonine protein kinase
VLERFSHERRILATLEHDQIARLYDGGRTDDGIPYLVIELVDGSSIDSYCDSRCLTIDERLMLFVRVCDAVQYAHQHLIVHRDIKPGNILVTHQGEPKLLDFGIAKVITAISGADETRMALMTPHYASPEQLRGDPISTGSDIYSLGVVLYRLIAGRLPFDPTGITPHELARLICDVEPKPPSTARTADSAALRDGRAARRRSAALPVRPCRHGDAGLPRLSRPIVHAPAHARSRRLRRCARAHDCRNRDDRD